MTDRLRLTDRKRADILRAAAEEFRSAGYEATSMDRVAAAAGVSKRTVYNHFPSKETLFAETLHQLWDSSLAGEDLAYRPGEPLPAQLRQLLIQKLDMLADPAFIDLARVAIAEMIHTPARARDMVARLGSREESVTTWVRAASADGRLSVPDAAFAAQQLQSLVKGFAFWPQVALGQPALDAAQRAQVAESAAAMFLASYAPGR